MKKPGIRIIFIIFTALLLGLIINQLHPKGVSIKILFHPTLLLQQNLSGEFYVISADSALILLDHSLVEFLDIRTSDDYQLDHISGAHYLSFNHLLSGFTDGIGIQPAAKVIIYDQEGEMEQLGLAAISLQQAGYKNIYLLFGGYLNWLQKGYSIERGAESHD
jgi:rhodanese-related sulfurtransferase